MRIPHLTIVQVQTTSILQLSRFFFLNFKFKKQQQQNSRTVIFEKIFDFMHL